MMRSTPNFSYVVTASVIFVLANHKNSERTHSICLSLSCVRWIWRNCIHHWQSIHRLVLHSHSSSSFPTFSPFFLRFFDFRVVLATKPKLWVYSLRSHVFSSAEPFNTSTCTTRRTAVDARRCDECYVQLTAFHVRPHNTRIPFVRFLFIGCLFLNLMIIIIMFHLKAHQTWGACVCVCASGWLYIIF